MPYLKYICYILNRYMKPQMDYIDRSILAQELIGYNLSNISETLHSNEAKMLLLGKVFDGEKVTLKTAVQMMWAKCVDDDMELCVNRAKAFIDEYVTKK